jgi:hypothetical protein
MRFPAARWRRFTAELALLTGMGAFMGAIGPYGTDRLPPALRLLYWEICITGGGLIGIAADVALSRFIGSPWRRLGPVSIGMTPFVTLLVFTVNRKLLGSHGSLSLYLFLLWRVFVICVPVMAIRALAWRPATLKIETRTIIAPPLPEAEAIFRRRLSARRRTAQLVAVEAEDHYLRVHTDAGDELITARFADALAELTQAHGFRVHRSWWVAADAIEKVRWRRGGGEASLRGGLAVPVSRTYASALKDAGWF